MDSTIRYIKKPHITEAQGRKEKEILSTFRSGQYALDAPYVVLNPYGIAPLTALVLFTTDASVSTSVRVHGKEAEGDVVHDFPEATEHILPIYGLYADHENRVTLTTSKGDSTTITIQTEPLDQRVPQATSIHTDASYMQGQWMFLTAAMRAVPVAYDYRGDVRWYATENLVFDLKRVRNGHILIGSERLVKMPYFTSGLYEMNLLGKVFKEYRLEGGYHHDQFEMEDGNILTLTFDFYSGTVEDMCVLLDRNTGEVLKSWDYKKVLPQDVAGSGSQDAHDWFHNNSVWYDKKNNALILSGRHQDAIISLDYDTGALNWIIGDPDGWPEDMQKYFFKPIGDNFEWQYEQHAAMVLPDGDIFVFDNGHFRSKQKEKYIKNSENYSRGVRYRIHTDTMTIEQVWSYGKERGPHFFSPYISNVEYYDEGHYMVHSGGIGYENGKICDGFAVTRAMSPKHKDKTYTFNSITCELKDDTLVYELEVPANFYRAEKMYAYAPEEIFEEGEGEILGALVRTQTTRMKIRAEDTESLIPESYQASLTEESDRLIFNGIFESGEMAQLLLENQQSDEVLRYPIDTVSKNFNAMCVGTFQKSDPRNTDVFINKEGLSGVYKMYLITEGKKYHTGLQIEV